jgi:hypothetical protein
MNSPLRRGATFATTVATAAFLVWCTRPGGQVVNLSEAGAATTGGVCIGACFPDPGSGPVDCNVQNEVDTLPLESFNNYVTSIGLPSAQGWYTYTDGTALLYFTDYTGSQASNGPSCYPPTSQSYSPGTTCGFEPPVASPFATGPLATITGPIAPCKPSADGGFIPGILHMYGGPFLGFGGGSGISMAKLNGRDPERQFMNAQPGPNDDPSAPKAFCCENAGASIATIDQCMPTTNAKFAAACPPTTGEFAVAIAALDASQYEGVSFWARRGTNGQEGLRVMVADKYIDDDLNYLAQRQQAATGQPQPLYCSRLRECACRNHQACQAFPASEVQNAVGTQLFPAFSGTLEPDTPLSFCGLPTQKLNLLSVCGNNALACVGLNGGPSFCCENTSCSQPYPPFPCDTLPDLPLFGDAAAGGATPGDIQFYGRPCTPYAFANGVNSSYCFDPATDPPPPPPTEMCGDYWMTTVTLGPDWTFYQVPFNTMHQQGFAKKSEQFDLHAVSNVRFSWDIGWVDYWINQVSFYRHTNNNN